MVSRSVSSSSRTSVGCGVRGGGADIEESARRGLENDVVPLGLKFPNGFDEVIGPGLEVTAGVGAGDDPANPANPANRPVVGGAGIYEPSETPECWR